MQEFMMMLYVKVKCRMHEVFTKEDGAVDIVAVVILIAVAVALALVFKEQITGMVEKLLKSVTGATDSFTEGL